MNITNSTFRTVDPDLGIVSSEQMSLRQPNLSDPKSSGFLDALQNSMQEVNENQLQADQSIKDLVAGKSKNIHETMLQIQKAELSLKTMMQVRNKILEAYKEIIRMQV